MKMVYLFNHYEVLENEHIGIRKKMYMQMKAFTELGYEPIYIVFDENKVVLKDLANTDSSIYHFDKLSRVYEFVIEIIKRINPEFIYMRYRMIYTPMLFSFYQKLSLLNTKIICEFYTFPYDTEFSEDDMNMLMDRIYVKRLKEVFQYSSNYNGYSVIMGIPSVSISNGIEVDKIPVSKLSARNTNEFHMIAVATMFPWHGYDRIIEGLYNYYLKKGERNILFHLVGEGQESNRYKELVKKYGLEKHIIFHGKITNNVELNHMYDGMDLAIGSIGMHRLRLENVSPIKSAEYCARGIPFIINYNDISFSEEETFVMKVSRDESPIDIKSIVAFALKNRNSETAELMREYAQNHLSWNSQMKKVLLFSQIMKEK